MFATRKELDVKSDEEIAALVERLFQSCVFDPRYMSESFAKERFREALLSLDDKEYEYIKKKMEEQI
jgi:hypothetical protein